MKKKIIVFCIVLVGVVLFALFCINRNANVVIVDDFSNVTGEINSGELMTVDVYEVNLKNSSQYVKSSGRITSFNIETLDIETGEKVKKLYVEDGQTVNKNEKIMLVSGYYNRTLKASINGLFFIVDNEDSVNEYKIYDTEETGISVNIAEKDIPYIKEGQKVLVNVIAINKQIEGQVDFISKLPNDNGKFNVKIKIPYDETIKFGYTANVKIEISSDEESLMVPYECICIDDEGKYYVVEEIYMEEFRNNSVQSEHRVYVEIEQFNEEVVKITSGIKEGMRILLWKW